VPAAPKPKLEASAGRVGVVVGADDDGVSENGRDVEGVDADEDVGRVKLNSLEVVGSFSFSGDGVENKDVVFEASDPNVKPVVFGALDVPKVGALVDVGKEKADLAPLSELIVGINPPGPPVDDGMNGLPPNERDGGVGIFRVESNGAFADDESTSIEEEVDVEGESYPY
jgi:hypothetical protein